MFGTRIHHNDRQNEEADIQNLKKPISTGRWFTLADLQQPVRGGVALELEPHVARLPCPHTSDRGERSVRGGLLQPSCRSRNK